MVDRNFRLKFFALASLLLVTSTTPALAEVACAPLAAIAKTLAESKFHEKPIGHMIAENGVMLIVFAAPGGATWTLIGVRAEHADTGYMLGSGTDYQEAPLPQLSNPS